MRIVADTHLHVYPSYRLPRLLEAACLNFEHAAAGAEIRALCLTERAGQSVFATLAGGARVPDGWHVHATPDPIALFLRAADGRELLLVAGRQVVAAEKIEVLALGTDEAIPDGLPVHDVLAKIRASNALPVLPWGLGKWWGRRGRLVRTLLEAATPADFAVADTYLLPALAARPSLLCAAARRGFRVLAGTDPLDRPGEESLPGRYGVYAEAAFDTRHPGQSLLRVLRDPAIPLTTVGRRGRVAETLRRMR